MHWLNEIGRALQMGAMMGWQMLWALILGFGLSAVVQATVSREKVAKLMPDGSPRSIATAGGTGMLRHMNEPMRHEDHDDGQGMHHGHHDYGDALNTAREALNQTLYVASSNVGKLRDFAAAAAVFGIEIAVLPGLTEIPAPMEDGATFEANARLKAETYSRARPGLLVLADDSGLEVDALDGAPGVRSARYAEDADFDATEGEDADGRNNLYLLDQLRGRSRPWTARYRCVLALARNGVTLLAADGAVEGEIIREPHGQGGFGYDPLFWLPELGKTMAEIDLETKQRLSHRGRALVALLAQMQGANL